MSNLRNGIKHPQQISMLIDENEALKRELLEANKKNTFLTSTLNQMANFNTDWDMLQASQESLRDYMLHLSKAMARISRLEENLIAVCDEYECDVIAKFTEADLIYPSMQKSKTSDMQIIIEARELLNESPTKSLKLHSADVIEEFMRVTPQVLIQGKYSSLFAYTGEQLIEYARNLRDKENKEGE